MKNLYRKFLSRNRFFPFNFVGKNMQKSIYKIIPLKYPRFFKNVGISIQFFCIQISGVNFTCFITVNWVFYANNFLYRFCTQVTSKISSQLPFLRFVPCKTNIKTINSRAARASITPKHFSARLFSACTLRFALICHKRCQTASFSIYTQCKKSGTRRVPDYINQLDLLIFLLHRYESQLCGARTLHA